METQDTKKNNQEARGRILRGVVTSDKMDKTIVVKVDRYVKHPFYGKYVKKSKKFKAHDENNKFSVGDIVEIRECRPWSKTVTFEVIEEATLAS